MQNIISRILRIYHNHNYETKIQFFHYSGKSLTFDEALAGAEMGDTDPEAEVKSKIPDQCCPLLCGKM
jgi:hypothetical protein